MRDDEGSPRGRRTGPGSNQPPQNLGPEDLATMSLTDLYNWYGQRILGPQAGLEQRIECGKWYAMGHLHAARADLWRRNTLYPYSLAEADPKVKAALDLYRDRLHEADRARAQEIMDWLVELNREQKEFWREQDQEMTLADFLKSSTAMRKQ